MVSTPRKSLIHAHPRIGANSDWVKEWHRSVTAQAGQDGVLERIFEIMRPRNKWCIEFGAWDGKHLSNTWNLINNHGWSAVMIEGNAEKANELGERYREREDVVCLNRWVGFEAGINCLDDLLAETACPRDPDFMSIDIDGNDWHVWESMEKFRPNLLLIEYNPTAPNDMYFVQERNFAVQKANSLLALVELGKKKGYELIAANHDAYFVKEEFFGLFPTGDNSNLDLMNSYMPDFFFFQGFDGTMLAAGTPRLIWQGMTFTEDDIQILPESARKLWWTE